MLDKFARFLLGLRNRHFLGLDLLVMCVTPAVALALRTDGPGVLGQFAAPLAYFTLAALVCKLVVFFPVGLYTRYWRYASVEEFNLVAFASFLVLLLELVAFFVVLQPLGLVPRPFPRSLPILDALLTFVVTGGLRFSVRVADNWLQRWQRGWPAKRVLVMGAGDAGAMIVREMRANPHLRLEPVGFLDDDPQKKGALIHGVRVLGQRQDIPRLANEYHASSVIIAMPTAPGKVIREVVTLCEQAGVSSQTIPGVYEIISGSVSVNQIRDVQIEDLLRREPVQTDIAAVVENMRGKRVLVTGGGGSIGSELCRQIMCCLPAELIVLGHGENSVFEISQELGTLQKRDSDTASTRISSVIADIRFPERIHEVFDHYRPEIVFHAAAHKHVPLMEANPAEAVNNNILGTRNLLEAAVAFNVERFVMVSTDKAVNPTSVMGASKRAAELLVYRAARLSGQPYVVVRFGNVLGSRGSVVLTFKKQIAAGGPVTVTHPEMRRYFMTIPEAVQLVLQASVLGRGGEIFVLDMGEPVKIADLARDLIELSGFEVERDIDIVYTGLRPGEKMFEELFVTGESYTRTAHEKIFVASNGNISNSEEWQAKEASLDFAIAELASAAAYSDRTAILRGLRRLVPEFHPENLADQIEPEDVMQPVEKVTR